MEVSIVGKPETIATPKSCCICSKDTDFMVAHKPNCHADAGCDCNLHVCSSTACEVRGVGRGIFHRTKINPRRNPMEMEVVEEAEVDEEPEVDLVSNPKHDPYKEDSFPREMDVECDGCGEPLKGIALVFTSPTESHYRFDDDAGPEDAEVEFYDENAFGVPMCEGCYDEAMEEADQYGYTSWLGDSYSKTYGSIDIARKNPAESKMAKYAKTGSLIGAGAILGWFLKDRLD